MRFPGAATALVLLAAACGHDVPSTCVDCDAGNAVQPDGGSDAGSAPLDLRFRGAQAGLVLAGDVLGAGDNLALTERGTAFTVADLEALGFLRLQISPRAPGEQYVSTTVATGDQCPTFFSSLMDGHFVVSGIGGDPALPTCTLSAVAADGGPTYTYLSDTGSSLDALAARLAADDVSRSYVVTAISATDGGVAYVAESIGPLPDGGLESFESQIAVADETNFNAQVEALADAGYVITAANSSFRNFVLVGTRPTGSITQHAANASQVPANFSAADIDPHQAEGYTATFYLDDVVQEADGGFDGGFYLLWQK